MAEQSRHGVADAVGIFEAFAEHHVAAALAMHRRVVCEAREPGAKTLRGRQRAGVQLRIAAGQPAAVAASAGGASSASGENGTISAPAVRQPARMCG